MKTAIIGGGPAGLFLANLIRRRDPAHAVTVLERNPAGNTFGWGVVFSDQTLGNLRSADPESYERITDNFAHWDDIDVQFRGTTITSGGHGFSGIARQTLLEILHDRARELGVDLRFGCEVEDDRALRRLGLADAQLVVAADGINSRTRTRYADRFRPELDERPARYIWLGTTRRFDAFTFLFAENEDGIFQAHAYRFSDTHSAFIVECDEASWLRAGLDGASTAESVRRCEQLFAPWLDDHRLQSNATQLRSPWIRFVRVSNECWYHRGPDGLDDPEGYVALIGDAAHTAHFSIGAGTKLAMEDAIALARILDEQPDLGTALEQYQEERKTEALRLQNAARNSMEWFENVKRYVGLEPAQFAYSLLTRSQRVSHENLRLRDTGYLDGVERWFASRAALGARATPPEAAASDGGRPVPPMFTPYRLRDLELRNRVVVSPMDMYSAEDGTPNEFHLIHLGARALGGAGLVVTEMTCVSPEARITLGCTGMYRDEHVAAWRRITDAVHRWSRTAICLQLGHSGRKGATRLMWEGIDEPLEQGGWEVVGPSALPYGPSNRIPREMTRDEMVAVRDQFVRATEMAVRAGFDMLELHCAHGYLLSSFITPVSNRRTDEYGGSLPNRLRFPLEVFDTVRAAWPEERPISVRISATDWVDEGLDAGEAVDVARAFHNAGADIIHVSTGQTTPDAQPVYGRMYQTPYSDRIRNEAGVPTIAVGNITEADQVNGIIAAGRADLCALGRPHLADPNWTLHAAAALGYGAQRWPVQYQSGKRQLERQIEKARAMQAEPAGTTTAE